MNSNQIIKRTLASALVSLGLLVMNVNAAESPAIHPPVSPVAAPSAASATQGATSTPAPKPVPPLVHPRGVAVDGDGFVYVVDYVNAVVYKVTPQGQISVLADGDGPGDKFLRPDSLTVDKAKNVYLADTANSVVRKISPDGTVVTLAGRVTHEQKIGVDGKGDLARFDIPTSIAVDSVGNLYVADNYSCVVRKVTPDGTVTTLAGKPGVPGSIDGKGAEVRFGKPRGVAVDEAGIVYVADESYHTIRKIAPDGSVTTLAGNPNYEAGDLDGVGTSAYFAAPRDLVVDARGNVYVADTDNHTIRKITPQGVVTTFAGAAGLSGYVDGKGAIARFNMPRGIAVDKDGNLFVADSENAAIRKITPDGVVTTVMKTPTAAATPVKVP